MDPVRRRLLRIAVARHAVHRAADGRGRQHRFARARVQVATVPRHAAWRSRHGRLHGRVRVRSRLREHGRPLLPERLHVRACGPAGFGLRMCPV